MAAAVDFMAHNSVLAAEADIHREVHCAIYRQSLGGTFGAGKNGLLPAASPLKEALRVSLRMTVQRTAHVGLRKCMDAGRYFRCIIQGVRKCKQRMDLGAS